MILYILQLAMADVSRHVIGYLEYYWIDLRRAGRSGKWNFYLSNNRFLWIKVDNRNSLLKVTKCIYGLFGNLQEHGENCRKLLIIYSEIMLQEY